MTNELSALSLIATISLSDNRDLSHATGLRRPINATLLSYSNLRSYSIRCWNSIVKRAPVLIQQCALDAGFIKWMAGRQQLVRRSRVQLCKCAPSMVVHFRVSYIHNCPGNHCQFKGKCCHLSHTNETSQKLQIRKWMDLLQVRVL